MFDRRTVLIWGIVALVVTLPIIAAGFSPQLAWRQPIYIIAGFAGILALALLFIQPLLILGALPGLTTRQTRSLHRWVGPMLILAVLTHLIGLWITSPPDVIDALLFRSPTPFSVWGVTAMWALFVAGAIVALRRKLKPPIWRRAHFGFVSIAVIGAVIHTLLIQGTMEQISKLMICFFVLLAWLINLGALMKRERTVAK